ncbi:MAG: DUF6452 family protein [Winogradskyella sp.]
MNLKKKHYFFIIALCLLGALSFHGCERDDICAEGTATTPRVIVEFYDASEPDELKSVPRLTVYGEGLLSDENGDPIDEPTSIADNGILQSDLTVLFNINRDNIELPLIIGDEGMIATTRFVLEKDTNLRINDDDTDDSNTDIIELSYTSEFQYVSRACGYKSIFNNLDINVEEGDDASFWINNIEVVQTTVNNENTVHVRIFH